MLGGSRLTFSYEKICQDIAGLVVLLSIPVLVPILGRLSFLPVVAILAFVIFESLLGLLVFYVSYLGVWKIVSSDLKASLRYRSNDEPTQRPPIKSYSELISWRRSQRAR
jgi:hypothetical protein